MGPEDIQLLYDYNHWANERILTQAERLTPAQFTTSTTLVWSSVRGTLVHILGAEWVWRSRWTGVSPTSLIDENEFPMFAALRRRWDAESHALQTFVAGLTQEKLNSRVGYHSTAGQPYEQVLWQMMAHVVNHGTQHRAEVAHVLTELDRSPGDVDMILYLRLR